MLIGDGAFAEIACEYFTHDSDLEVVAFAVERPYLRREQLLGLPVVAFEELERSHPPADHWFYAAIGFNQRNALRTRFYEAAKARGYRPASFVSPRAFVWHNVVLGEHCFVFEDNVLQPFVSIGHNVVLWSGNHVGHHSRIGDHCFVSSHVVISGGVRLGHSCFLGVNATFADGVTVGDRSLVGAGALVLGDVGHDETVIGIRKRSKAP